MLKNNKGFSLVEVLVTVGLIGILVGIAVPQYGKYKARTGTVALKADMSSAQKAYTSYDAVNNTLCADFVKVGLANGPGDTIYTQSTLYRKQSFIGFTDVAPDCVLSDPVLNYSSRLPDSYTESSCGEYGGTWVAGPPAACNNVPAGNNWTGAASACVLGSDSFILGASTGVSNIGENMTKVFLSIKLVLLPLPILEIFVPLLHNL